MLKVAGCRHSCQIQHGVVIGSEVEVTNEHPHIAGHGIIHTETEGKDTALVFTGQLRPYKGIVRLFVTAVKGKALFIGYPCDSISFICFFLPFGLAFICMIPCIPIYLKEDMTIPQIMWQRGIELVVLEIAMCAVIYLIMGDSVSRIVYVAILISTAVCDVLSYLVKWYLEKEEADKINRKIAEHRRKKENE